MAIINVSDQNTIDQWRQKNNQLAEQVGDLADLETSETTSLVAAINSLDSTALQDDLDALTVRVDTAEDTLSGAVSDISTLESHASSTSNPHSVTKTQVGLSDVTNDAQLKRADGDIASFSELAEQANAVDLFLIEDASATNAKKKIKAENILPAVLPNDHEFSGDVVFSGTVTIGTESLGSVSNITTTDATNTNLFSIPITNNNAVFFSVKIVGRMTTASDNKTYWSFIKGAVRRNSAGSAVLVGTMMKEEDMENCSYSSNVTVSGSNLNIYVTGAVEEVRWSAQLDYFSVS